MDGPIVLNLEQTVLQQVTTPRFASTILGLHVLEHSSSYFTRPTITTPQRLVSPAAVAAGAGAGVAAASAASASASAAAAAAAGTCLRSRSRPLSHTTHTSDTPSKAIGYRLVKVNRL